jgi:hypothetical protein
MIQSAVVVMERLFSALPTSSRWSEGEKIGLEGRGIDAPITAVMKKSKLGLGATR